MWVYNFGVFIYWSFIQTASLFHVKAHLWVTGRKNIFEQIKNTLKEKNINSNSKVIWFHCASLGEFEQGRPIIESLKTKNKDVKVILTFFSPSGYEIRKDYEYADAVFYLPIDFPSNAKKFISLIKPHAAVFVKYEFWLNYLAELKKQNITTYLVCAVFRKNQHFFKGYGKLFLNSLHIYKKIFLQDENSFNLLKEWGLTNIEVVGDTRFDRVMEIRKSKISFIKIEKFCGTAPVIIAGSTWSKDEELVLATYKKLKTKIPNLKLILIPHEVDEASINQAEKTILHTDSTIFFARYTRQQNFERHDILIIDTIGILSQIYRYARVAYIGGGFNGGLHSCLEAAVYGVPVTFYGNKYLKYVEAVDLINLGVATNVYNSEELYKIWDLFLTNEKMRNEIADKINPYFEKKSNVSLKLLSAMEF